MTAKQYRRQPTTGRSARCGRWASILWRGQSILVTVLLGLFMVKMLPAQDPAWLNGELASLNQLYLYFHSHPELSYDEKETSARLAKELSHVGAEVTPNVGGHGVVGVLKNGEGPTVMIRTDMDALPIVENTDQPYASTVKVTDKSENTVGVMHACGHDLHMTNLVGVARFLSQHRALWSGTALFVCQPAEERGAGSQAMIDDGLFDRFPKPDFALALHVFPDLPTGYVALRAGYVMANVNSVDVTLHGRGGHGAFPQSTVDPIVQAAKYILDLQTIVSREVNPIEPAVITVGSIHAGTKHNIISDTCELQLTVRSYSDEVRALLLEAIERKAKAAAASVNADEPTISISEGTPSVFNDEDLVERIRPVFEELLGQDHVVDSKPVMGGEDFSNYSREGKFPSLMFSLGAVEGRRIARYQKLGISNPSLHSAEFYPDFEAALRTGVTTMSGAAISLMPVK